MGSRELHQRRQENGINIGAHSSPRQLLWRGRNHYPQVMLGSNGESWPWDQGRMAVIRYKVFLAPISGLILTWYWWRNRFCYQAASFMKRAKCERGVECGAMPSNQS